MPFFLDGNPTPGEISEAVNYVLANLDNNVVANQATGQVVGPSGEVTGYLYKYISIKYADSFDGTLNFSDISTNRLYYGIRNSDSSVESTNPADYVWNTVTGGFGTTKFLYYITTGGRTIQFAVATAVPNTGWFIDPGTAIDLDFTTASSAVANFVVIRVANNSAAPTDAECIAAIGRTPISGDLCTVNYNSGIFSIVYKYTTGWAVFQKYITGDLIVANSIVGNNIAANTITASQIAVNTISANNMAANSITAANAAIADAAITSAKIGDLQVNTLQIANNAVTVSASIFSTGGSVNLTFNSNGAPVCIMAFGAARGAAYDVFIDIKIDGSTIFSSVFIEGDYTDETTGFAQSTGAASTVITPASGNKTFNVSLRGVYNPPPGGSGGAWAPVNCGMLLLGVKK